MTVSDLCTQAMREINAVAQNQRPRPEDLMLVIGRFNLMIDELKTDQVTVSHVSRATYNLVANQASYTIGPGGDWDGQRPQQLVRAGFVNTYVDPTNPLETPLHVLTDEEWADINLKTQSSTVIWGLWYETDFNPTGTNNAGLGRMWTRPIVTVNAQVAIYAAQALDEVTEDAAGLATVLHVPPGYRNMYLYNLALDICDIFEKQPSALLVKKADRSMTRVKRQNSKPIVLRLPAQLTRKQRRGFNILTNG